MMTKLIRVRSLRLSDLPAYEKIVRKPQIARGAQFPLVKSHQQAEQMLKDDLRSLKSYAVTLNQDDRLIGEILLDATIGNYQAPDFHQLLLGYFLSPHFQGRGCMTAALKMIVHKCFQSVVIESLIADVSENNIASIRVLQKTGFVNYHSILNLKRNHEDLLFERQV